MAISLLVGYVKNCLALHCIFAFVFVEARELPHRPRVNKCPHVSIMACGIETVQMPTPPSACRHSGQLILWAADYKALESLVPRQARRLENRMQSPKMTWLSKAEQLSVTPLELIRVGAVNAVT